MEAMIGEAAGRRFALKLSALLAEASCSESSEQALLELMFGYALGNLKAMGASEDDLRVFFARALGLIGAN